ncbi:hypothetical protein MMC29_000868, partial [Sticta canariensis]|nr:hypothetical protein [Sticta canariensis]
MADFTPPAGPPPPKVPEGWKAQWNDQYSEWFYVNLQTGKSTWEKPTAPAYASSSAEPPSGAPPSYTGQGITGAEKSSLHSNNPYSSQTSQPTIDDDARLARELQAEEDARGPISRNAQNDYQNTATPQSNAQPELPPREQKRSSGLGGLLSKFTGKHSGGSNQSYGSQ